MLSKGKNFSLFFQEKFQIVLLQETHLSDIEHMKLCRLARFFSPLIRPTAGELQFFFIKRWNGRKPRQKIKSLQMPVELGGLDMPNILYYNWACHARLIREWYRSYCDLCLSVDSSPLGLFPILYLEPVCLPL